MAFKRLLTKRMEFAASHRYWNPQWTAQKNRSVFGKSASDHGHGHNYLLEVTVEGEVDPETGMIVNISILKTLMAEVLEGFDHKYLNEDNPHFKELIPTTENIAMVLWNLLYEKIKVTQSSYNLYRVRLYETNDMYVDYWRRD